MLFTSVDPLYCEATEPRFTSYLFILKRPVVYIPARKRYVHFIFNDVCPITFNKRRSHAAFYKRLWHLQKIKATTKMVFSATLVFFSISIARIVYVEYPIYICSIDITHGRIALSLMSANLIRCHIHTHFIVNIYFFYSIIFFIFLSIFLYNS